MMCIQRARRDCYITECARNYINNKSTKYSTKIISRGDWLKSSRKQHCPFWCIILHMDSPSWMCTIMNMCRLNVSFEKINIKMFIPSWNIAWSSMNHFLKLLLLNEIEDTYSNILNIYFALSGYQIGMSFLCTYGYFLIENGHIHLTNYH